MQTATPFKTLALRASRGVLSAAKKMGLSKSIAKFGVRFASSPSRFKKSFDGYTVTERDVFVCTAAKAGTNWTMQMALSIAHLGEVDFEHIHDLVPWPDTPEEGPIGLDDPRSWEGSPTGLRVIKTHATAECVPFSDEAHYIVVLRDPKELLVSSYHFATKLMNLSDTISPDDWLELILELAEKRRSRTIDHLAGWWALRNEPNVLVLSFAEMKANHEGAVEAIAEHLGVELTSDQAATVKKRSTIAWMKANQGRFEPIPLPFAEPTEMPDMIRKGEAGGANELYTDEQLARLDAYLLDEIERRGIDFPYAEIFNVVSVEAA